MKKGLKWIGFILLGLVVILLAGGAVLYSTSSSRLSNGPDVTVNTVAAASDAGAIARGDHLAVAISGCTSCHGEDLSGIVTVEDPAIGTIYAEMARDTPPFFVEYAELMSLLLTLMLATASGSLALRKWFQRTKKNRIDVYYLEIRDTVEAFETGQTSAGEARSTLLELREQNLELPA